MIRIAKPSDIPAMLKIYSPFILHSAVSFELEVPDEEEFKNRLQKVQKKYPWLVYDVQGEIAGYAYASLYRERKAYQWSVETTIYLHPDYFGKGISEMLYKMLLKQLAELGYHTAYAIITTPNPASEGFHKKMGFETIGVFPEAGYKFGKWHDVKWMRFSLKPPGTTPIAQPENFTDLR